MEDETLRHAFENWEALSGTKEEIAAYKARVKQLFDEESMIIEAEMRGKEEGEKEGKKEGIEIGISQALTETVLQLLSIKFGNIPEDIEASLKKSSPKTLKRLIDHIFNLSEISDVQDYLQ